MSCPAPSVENSANHPVTAGLSRQPGGTRRKQFPSPSWQYLYPPPTTNAASSPETREVEGDRGERVVDVDEERRPHPLAPLGDVSQAFHDARVAIQDRRQQGARRSVVHGQAQSLRERVDRARGDPYDGEPFLLQSVELASDRVEFPVRGHESGAVAQGQCGEKADHQLMRIGTEGIVPVIGAPRAPEEPGVPRPHTVRTCEGLVPFPVDEAGRVLPGPPLAAEPAVRPRLMRMPGEEKSFGHPEPRVVCSERVRFAAKLLERARSHRSVRIAHRSGNTGRFSEFLR